MKSLIARMSLFGLVIAAAQSGAVIRENGGFMVPSAAKIEMISIGAGIDTDLKNKAEALILLQSKAGLVEQYVNEIYGFEGETRICVLLNDYDASIALNTQLVELVEAGKPGLSHIEFVASCK